MRAKRRQETNPSDKVIASLACLVRRIHSLNSSAIYLGSAMGAAVGALVIADGGVRWLSWMAAAFSVAALLTVPMRARSLKTSEGD